MSLLERLVVALFVAGSACGAPSKRQAGPCVGMECLEKIIHQDSEKPAEKTLTNGEAEAPKLTPHNNSIAEADHNSSAVYNASSAIANEQGQVLLENSNNSNSNSTNKFIAELAGEFNSINVSAHESTTLAEKVVSDDSQGRSNMNLEDPDSLLHPSGERHSDNHSPAAMVSEGNRPVFKVSDPDSMLHPEGHKHEKKPAKTFESMKEHKSSADFNFAAANAPGVEDLHAVLHGNMNHKIKSIVMAKLSANEKFELLHRQRLQQEGLHQPSYYSPLSISDGKTIKEIGARRYSDKIQKIPKSATESQTKGDKESQIGDYVGVNMLEDMNIIGSSDQLNSKHHHKDNHNHHKSYDRQTLIKDRHMERHDEA